MVGPLRRIEEVFMGRSGAALLEEVFKSLRGDALVLDAGCGSGYLSLEIAKRLDEGRVSCIDLSEEMLAVLARRAEAGGVDDRIREVSAAVDATGLEGATFDYVVSNNVLHELSDPGAAIAEWKRLLKPGGRMALSDFRNTMLTRLLMSHAHRDENGSGPFDIAGLTALLLRAGLQDVDVRRCRNKLLALARKPA